MKIPLPRNFNPPKPLKIYDYQDVIITLFASSLKSRQFSLAKLRRENVIPSDWRLDKPMKKKTGTLHLSFTQGVNISISQGKIVFSQKRINPKTDLAQVVQRFITKFNNHNYTRSQLIIRRVITLPSKKDSATRFIQNNLLNGINWQVEGRKPIKAQVNYHYPQLVCPLIINVLDLLVDNPKLKSKSCLLFRGILDYQSYQNSQSQSDNSLISFFDLYSENRKTFNQIVD